MLDDVEVDPLSSSALQLACAMPSLGPRRAGGTCGAGSGGSASRYDVEHDDPVPMPPVPAIAPPVPAPPPLALLAPASALPACELQPTHAAITMSDTNPPAK